MSNFKFGDNMETKRDLTRKKIIEAAYNCFSEYGYAKTNFSDVAKKAGISRSLIYLYFKTRKDLFFTMTDERHDSYVAQSKKLLDFDVSKKEKLQRIIDIWLIDEYKVIQKTPTPNIWLDELKSVGQSELKYRELFIKSLTPLVSKDLAEVFVLACRGILDDRPTVRTLKKRVNILLEMLV
jgi:TetR/AcrR family transcriptional regulator, transcriptional repressor of aconitase